MTNIFYKKSNRLVFGIIFITKLTKHNNHLNRKLLSTTAAYNKKYNIPDITDSNSKAEKKELKNIFHRFKPIMDVPDGIFKGLIDRFNGVTISSLDEKTSAELFPEKLQKSLQWWSDNNKRGIWFKVDTKNSEWVPHLTKEGFNFHHAKRDYVMLFKWLPKNEAENIPVYCHTMIGVGGLVVDQINKEILVVSDRYAMIPNSWKLPGGYVEPKENLIDAAIREVREETGCETKFISVVSYRHSHGGSFGSSDLYIVIALEPLDLSNKKLIRCEREIAKLEWMPFDAYLNNPNVHETNRSFLKTFLDYQKNNIKWDCVSGIHQILKKEFSLYFVKKSSD